MNEAEYRKKLYEELIADMKQHMVGFHRQGKCKCMKTHDPANISVLNAVPCRHLEREQWDLFKERINEIDDLFHEHWTSRMHGGLK